MEIILHDGKKEVMLRGNDGTFELCWQKNVKDKETQEVRQEWSAEKYYASIPAALDALMKLKISNSDISTLEELQNEIIRIRKDMLKIYS